MRYVVEATGSSSWWGTRKRTPVGELSLKPTWLRFGSRSNPVESESNGAPDRLCYNIEQAAKVVGVSVHKLNSWLRRIEHPLPHI